MFSVPVLSLSLFKAEEKCMHAVNATLRLERGEIAYDGDVCGHPNESANTNNNNNRNDNNNNNYVDLEHTYRKTLIFANILSPSEVSCIHILYWCPNHP